MRLGIERETALPRNCYVVCAPDGPDTPFAWPTLFWVDSFRCLVMALGLVLLFWTLRKCLDTPSVGQRARLGGQALFAIVTIGTEFDYLGDYSHYRLYVSFFGILLMLWGTFRMKFEVPPRDRAPARDGA